MQKIFILILNWNQPKLTIDCLKSIRELRIDDYELKIVVVDNASSDDSVDRIKQGIKGIKSTKNINYELIVNDENFGFAGGNNVGIRYSLENGADFILLLNNDTVVHKDLVFNLLKVATKYPKAGILSPMIYFAKGYEFHKPRYKKSELGKVIWAVGGEIDWGNVYGSNRGVDEVDIGQYDKVKSVDFASGACVLIRHEALKKVDAFDEKYFMYFEDVDLSVRMKKSGWEILYVPDAKLWHKVAQSSAIGGALNDYFIARNRLLFAGKYASLRTRFALFRESVRHLANGREWQRKGVVDYYLRRFGKGSWS